MRANSEELSPNRAETPRFGIRIQPVGPPQTSDGPLSLGCRVGIERLDHHVGHLGRLHGLGLHSVKLSRAVVQGALQDTAAQALLRGLCSIGHAMGVQVIADGIARAEDATLLFELGFDGVNALSPD